LSPSTLLRTILRLIGPAGLALAGTVAACADAPVPVRVLAQLDGTPVAGLEVSALPYDPERMLDSLAALHGVPRPDFSALEADLAAFVMSEPAPDDATVQAWRATRDSTAALADSLRGIDRRSPGYGAAYRQFRALYARLVARAAVVDAARSAELEPVRTLARRAARAADSLRAWEATAYAGFDEAAAAAVAVAHRDPVRGLSADDGWLTLSLQPGPWWLVAVLPDSTNPFLEHRWSVPITAGPFPINVRLGPQTARTSWRH
jgi:hypothetical protein